MTTTLGRTRDVPTPAPTPAIDVRDLRMSYGATEVLRGVDLSIATGEVVALLGPNGAGKTTTIEILEGFRAPSAGHVRVLGVEPIRGQDSWRADLGVVLQSWRDHARWRVRETLHHFALALAIGICFGIYSSALVMATLVMWLGVSREDLVKPEKKAWEKKGNPYPLIKAAKILCLPTCPLKSLISQAPRLMARLGYPRPY